MQKVFLFWVLSASMILMSCTSTVTTSEADLNSPASQPDLQPDSKTSNLAIPYSEYIRFEQISLEEGLSQSVVNAILQDSQGFLWVGTDDGLNRYDGYNFKIYKPDSNNPFSISDRTITAIIEDEKGFLWIGTRAGGLNRYDPITGQFTHYFANSANAKSIASNQISDLALDETGLWIGTNRGLDYLDFESNSFTHYNDTTNSPIKLSNINITDILKASSGLLWVGTINGGVTVLDQKQNTFTVYSYDKNDVRSLSHNRVLSLAEGENGEIWVGTSNGLNQFIPLGNYFVRYRNSKSSITSLAGNIVYSIFFDSSGSVWVGTNNGLDRLDTLTKQFAHHQAQANISNSLSSNDVFTIYEDASGVLWIGTYGGGLNKYNRQQDRFAYYRHNPNNPNSLSSNFIFPILADDKGMIWIGTLDNGLNRFDPRRKTFVTYQHNPSSLSTLDNNTVISLFEDKNGVLWVGTGSALNRYNASANTFSSYQPTEMISADNTRFSVFCMYEDSEQNFWVGSSGGLLLFDREDNIFTQYQSEGSPRGSGLSNIKINAILEDKEQNLWIGTSDNGLKRLNLKNDEITSYGYDPEYGSALKSNTILSMYQDSKGRLWVGTHGGGLSLYNPQDDAFTHFTENEGLPNNVIYGILEDEAGNLWLSTNFGISKFNPEKKIFRNFTANDGLQSNEFNQNAFAKDKNGLMYFAGINGLNVFEPQEIVDSAYAPKIALTSLTLDGETFTNNERTIEHLETITITYPQDSFEFEFSAFAFEQPAKNQYAYMLKDFDADWINIGTQHNGRYTNLSGGTYTLLLRGSNSDGVWSEQTQAIKVIVVPPYWETWWFRALLVLFAGAVITGGLRWRVKSVENRNRELERLVRKRTLDLEKRNTEIEALYQADEKILRSVTLNQIFQTLVDVSVAILHADRSVIFTWNENKKKIMPRVSKGFAPETLEVLNFDYDEGMIGIAIKTSAAFIVSDVRASSLRPDIQTALNREGVESFAHFPIVVDDKVVAIFNVAYIRPNALTKDAVRLFTALVNRASMSIANMNLFEQTKDLAVMEERNRLARDLHDSAKQKAFAALAQLGTVNGISKTMTHEALPHVSEAETLIYEVIQELNFLIQEIYPIALQEKGLETTLREYIFEWENRNEVQVNLQIQNCRELPLELEQAVYRVIQEALANIARHSKAKRVDISLVYNPELLQVMIADDGCGFDMNQKPKGVGFRSMRERINSVRGTFQVQSTPNQGTRLIIQIPLKN